MDEFATSTILVVDDEDSNIDILLQVLGNDYDIAVALDGESALERVQDITPDLIILDIIMPEMDGYEVCQKLKQDKATASIPIIFITAKDDTLDESKGLEMGAVDYIPKPIRPSIVKARVKNHLELKFARQELEKRNRYLENTLQLREDIAQMLVHDMRNPLFIISAYNDLLVRREAVKPEYLRYVENIRSAAQLLNSFISEMLMAAKTESEQLIMDQSSVGARELAEQMQQMYAEVLKTKGLTLTTELPQGGSPSLLLDKKLFLRVLDNLLSNASKFSPPESEIKLRFEYFVDAGEKNPKRKLRIQVMDQGPGVPDADKQKIFQKFSTSEAKDKKVSQIGLGLAFCKMVVEAHGGKIFVTDNQPQGAIFTIEV